MKITTKSNFTGQWERQFWSLHKMMTKNQNSVHFGFLLLTLSIISCQPNTISFNSFEPELWKADAQSCKGYRNEVIMDMEAEFDQFIGMSETELITYLGSPDKTLLYTRGQKFFSYNINCTKEASAKSQLRVRFSALDYVNEVLILD